VLKQLGWAVTHPRGVGKFLFCLGFWGGGVGGGAGVHGGTLCGGAQPHTTGLGAARLVQVIHRLTP